MRRAVTAGAVRDALRAQAAAAYDWLAALPAGDWTRPSVLPGWRIADLAEHLATVHRGTRQALERPAGDEPMSAAQYVQRMADARDEIRDRDRAAVADRGPEELLAQLREQAALTGEALTRFGDDLGRTVTPRRGPVPAATYLASRAVELVVHTDDLGRSAPDRPPPGVDRGALGTAVRFLTGVLAERAPGRSVEVRVPPFAAVQCVAGPRHTRGTPPNVVEAEPLAWVRLATGRVSWSDTLRSGAVTASGGRADLTAYLPVLS